ncbi:MAG TPA: hypothetical protein VE913_19765 [Longimicrobium sp.]|nr:hypothetical protein [Longimicrobium sp.]
MTDFPQIALTFPTVVYSVLLAACAACWLLAATGLVDGDAVPEGGGGGVLAWLGVAGVPVLLVTTVFALAAWLAAYFAQLLVVRHLPGGVGTLAGWATMLGALVPAAAATSLLLRPVGRMLARLRPPADASLIGRSGIVVTSTLDAEYGQASFDDGGAGLILQVRHDPPHVLRRGDLVVLVEYIEGQNAYRVVPEQHFLGR